MKQAQNARKQRGRPSARQNGKAGGQGNRSEQKVRGNPKQLVEKYKNQAREALQAGDRTQAEYFLQFADHYYRVLNEARGNQGQNDDGGQNNSRRRRRGRGQQDSQPEAQAAAENGAAKETPAEQPAAPASAANSAEPSGEAQPIEVHPELNLDDEAAKPARRRRPPRKKVAPADTGAGEKPAAVAETDVA